MVSLGTGLQLKASDQYLTRFQILCAGDAAWGTGLLHFYIQKK